MAFKYTLRDVREAAFLYEKPTRQGWKRHQGACFNAVITALAAVGVVVAVVIVFEITATTPSTQSIGGDVKILYNNDLDGDRSANQQSTLVLPFPSNYATATKNCMRLSESLYDAEDANNDFLRYLAFPEGASESDLYWTAKHPDDDTCNVINALGIKQQANCNEQHMTLCGNSAPVAHVANTDRSHSWQIDVNVGNRTYTGYRDRRSFRFFGMKYATSTRWEHATQYEPAGSFSAILPGDVCAQPPGYGVEDCLFLNIWTPYIPYRGNESTSLRPVMVYIHGGAFVNGHGNGDDTDGGNLASRGDVVVVTMNYRLSTLGFLALNDGVTTGNYGIGDQSVALQWVQDHIRDFGGDPGNVILFGQSAGASSVRAHLGVPQSRGKFHGAMMQSNLGGTDWARTYSYYNNVTWAMEWAGDGVLSDTGCGRTDGDDYKQLECLKKMDALDIQRLPTQARFLIVDDEYILRPQIAINSSTNPDETAHVPIVMGTMADDSVNFIPEPESLNLTESLNAYGFDFNKLIGSGNFPVVDSSDNETIAIFNVTARASMDSMYRCMGQATAATAANARAFPNLWYYEFHRAYSVEFSRDICYPPKTLAHPWGDPEGMYYKCHSGDLTYTFGNVAYRDLPLRDDFDLPFSQYVLDLWASFARNHNPNPDIPYLQARGYNSTIALIEQAGAWYPVGGTSDGWRMRRLKQGIEDVPFSEMAQCDTLGLPITFYDAPAPVEDDAPFPVPMYDVENQEYVSDTATVSHTIDAPALPTPPL